MAHIYFYNKDFENLGVTLHKCTDKLDAGDIAGQEYYKLQKDDRIYTLRYKTTLVALEVLKKTLDRFSKGEVTYKQQGPGNMWRSRDMTVIKKIVSRKNLNKFLKKTTI